MALLHGLLLVVARESGCWSYGLFRVDTNPAADPMDGFLSVSAEARSQDEALRLAMREAGKREPITGYYRHTGLLPGEDINLSKRKSKTPAPVWVEFSAKELSEVAVDGNPLNLFRVLPLALAHARKAVA